MKKTIICSLVVVFIEWRSSCSVSLRMNWQNDPIKIERERHDYDPQILILHFLFLSFGKCFRKVRWRLWETLYNNWRRRATSSCLGPRCCGMTVSLVPGNWSGRTSSMRKTGTRQNDLLFLTCLPCFRTKYFCMAFRVCLFIFFCAPALRAGDK